MLLALLAAAVTASASAAPAQPAAAPAAAVAPTPPGAAQSPAEIQAAAQAEAGKKFHCSYEEVTGSRFPKKVCRRIDDMATKQAEDQARIRDMQRTTGGMHY